jgi:hypothetical protein
LFVQVVLVTSDNPAVGRKVLGDEFPNLGAGQGGAGFKGDIFHLMDNVKGTMRSAHPRQRAPRADYSVYMFVNHDKQSPEVSAAH